MGGKDIFYSIKNNGEWKSPVNIGSTINTEFDEESVFYYNDTLYFASKGHNSIGGYDIFRTYKNESGQWYPAENLGIPVNSPYDDLFFSKNMQRAYFSSDRTGGLGGMDIYTFIYLVKKPQIVIAEADTGFTEIKKDTTIISAEIVEASDILFKMNQYQVKSYNPNLNSIVHFLIAEPEARILITGYSDSQGSKSYNLRLSKKRANSVKQYLLEKGVNKKCLTVDAKGEEGQLSKNVNEKGEFIVESLPYNRRVEFKVIKQGKKKHLHIKRIEVPKEYKK